MQKCPHVLDKHSKITLLENFFFCRNCGSILCQTKPNKFLTTVKPVESESQTEIDPIDLFVNSFKQTPFIKIKKEEEKKSQVIPLRFHPNITVNKGRFPCSLSSFFQM